MQKVFLVLLIIAATCTLSGCANRKESSLASTMARTENLVSVRLDGANEAAIAEIFGKVVSSADGVVAAKRYATHIVADTPQACFIDWRVSTAGIDAFELQTTTMEMIREIFRAGGYLELNGVSYRYTKSEIALLAGLRPATATSRELRFTIDRELARDRELSGWWR